MIDFEKEIKKARIENISNVRAEIKTKEMQKKINNYASNFDLKVEDVENEIMNNDMFIPIFCKDPLKQNICETKVSDYIKNIEGIFDYIKYSNKHPKYVVNGEITNEKPKIGKNIDFHFKFNDKIFYGSIKHTQNNGGAQDNQYNDVCTFLEHCNKKDEGNIYFLAIVDGKYYDNKIEKMKLNYESNNVKILRHYEIITFLSNLK